MPPLGIQRRPRPPTSTSPFDKAGSLLPRDQTTLFGTGGLIGHCYRRSGMALSLSLAGGDNEVPGRGRDDEHAKAEEAENEMAIQWERAGFVDGPSKNDGEDRRAG